MKKHKLFKINDIYYMSNLEPIYEEDIIKLVDERDKYKEILDKIKEYINKTTYKEVFKDDEHSIKEFWFIKDILELLEEIE